MSQLLPTQARVRDEMLRRSWKRIIWTAPIRTGKGYGTANALIELAIARYAAGEGNGEFGVAGATAGSFMRNNEGYLRDAAESRGLRMYSKANHYVLEPLNVKLHLWGGGDKRSYASVRGATLDAAWVDEATLCDKLFMQTVEERLSFRGSQLVLTQNADSPSHWLKREWMDEAPPGTLQLESSFDENIHYPQERREFLLAQNPHTTNYQRALLNVWTGVEGLVYPIPDSAIVDHDTMRRSGDIVIDPGTAGVTAALLCVRQPDGTYVIEDEYYHEGDRQGRLTDQEHWRRVRAKWTPMRVYIDDAAAHFKAMVSRQGGPTPQRVNKEFELGVLHVNNCLHSGQIKIHQRCANLLMEAASYQWNPGRTAPVLSPDHALDCLRYIACAVIPPQAAILMTGRRATDGRHRRVS